MGNYLNAYKVDLNKLVSLYKSGENLDDLGYSLVDEIYSKILKDDYSAYLIKEREIYLNEYIQVNVLEERSESSMGYLFIALCCIYGTPLGNNSVPFIISKKLEELFEKLQIDFHSISCRYEILPFNEPSREDMWPLIGYLTNHECKKISEIFSQLSIDEYTNDCEIKNFLNPFFNWIELVIASTEDLIITYY